MNQLATESRAAKAEAEVWARKRGIPIRYSDGWNIYELMYLEDGRPVYNKTDNVNAAISTTTDMVRDYTSYYLKGSGLTIGVWDGGGVLSTHQEFDSRVSQVDSTSSVSDHATHVAGTIGASGIEPLAKGMAPNVNIDSYDWNEDLSEMANRGVSAPDQPNKIYLSNHSYSHISGWDRDDLSGNKGWHWSRAAHWDGASSVEDNFGQYNSTASTWDEVAYNAPYYLIFKSAGNDRDDNPEIGDTVYYTRNGGESWDSISYSTLTCPLGDGIVKSGYDTIPHNGVAKNVITVGSVSDIVACGVRLLPKATMSTFSNWGPTDDGRIKTDIVANGEGLISSSATGNPPYAIANGTSQSTPNASGSAILLVEYYGKLFPGQAMRSSTLKGLIIHTADDLGNPGPDYSFGWGVMNTARAITLIKQHHDDPSANLIVEGLLNARNPDDSYNIINYSRSPIRATLCWTDPPANAITGHDDKSPRLMNDLDLRIISSGGSTYYPYVLDPSNPSDAATTGDNTLDNIEQIYRRPSWPGFGESEYTVQVSHKGTLWNDEQYYSLIINLGDISTMCPPVRTEYKSNDTPKAIQDKGTTTSSFDITDSGKIADLNVKLNIQHLRDADLDVFLTRQSFTELIGGGVGVDPSSAIRVQLFTDVGGTGDDFYNTILDDEASRSIRDGASPFTGLYKPEGRLSDFDGEMSAGRWTLEVRDDSSGYNGTLNSWSLIVEEVEKVQCSTTIESSDKEGFESGYGEWVNIDTCDKDWRRRGGGTPSSGTGPSSAHEGDYYLYIESSGEDDGFPNKIAILESPCLFPYFPVKRHLPFLGIELSLSFWYHMYGTEMGTLIVEVSSQNRPWTLVWSRSGNQGNTWHETQIHRYFDVGEVIKIRFIGVTGAGNTSDISIDDIDCMVYYTD